MIEPVRTTLDLDDDVLMAAKELAVLQHKTAGQVVSELARRALQPPKVHEIRNGVPVVPRAQGGRIITSSAVRRWLDDD